MANYYVNIDGTITKEKKKKKKDLVDNVVDFGKGVFNLPTNVIKGVYDAGKSAVDEVGENGYQFGDITKTGLKTVGNIATNVTHGTVKALENFYDFTENASSNINTRLNEKLGIQTKEQAANERAKAQEIIKRDLTTEAENALGWTDELRNEWEKGSLVKRENIGGQVSQAVGEMLPTLIVGNAVGSVPSNATKVQKLISTIPTTQTLGVSSYGGALEQAYNEGATTSQANKYALGSALTEVATEWLTGGVPGVNDKGLLDSLEEKTLNKVSNNLARFIIKEGYNVVGEGAEEALSEIINPILKNATYSQGEKVNWNDVIQSAIVGGITGGILDLPGNISTYKSNANTQQQNQNNLSENKQSSINLPPQQESPLAKLQRTNIEQRQQINQQVEQELATRRNGINQELNLPTVSTEGMNLMESASRYNIKPETQSAVQNLMENRGIESRWDATRFNDNSVNALWTKDANGNRQVIFNPNASLDTIVEEVAVHELTHDILSSENTTLNSQEVLNYVKTLQGYNEARQSLENTYATMYDPNSAEFNSLIDEEVVADVLGRKLGNQEFINQLVNSKPSVAKSIYNWVVNKLNSIVNKGKVRSEKLYWQNIKNNFENAYKQEYKNNEMASTKYKVSDINADNQGRTLSKQQQEYFKNSKVRDENGNLITVYHTTTDKVAQFNEFNPVGTEGYRFGENVVNFYTNSKTMSGSYADYNYKMADTKTTKLNSLSEVNDYINNFNKNNNDNFEIVKDSDTQNGYLLMRGNNTYEEYSSKNILLRSVIDDINKITGEKANYQYEGYVNITNPYVIDAKEENWDNIVTGYNTYDVEHLLKLDDNLKQQLIDLANESIDFEKNARNKIVELQKKLGEIATIYGGYTNAKKISKEFNNLEQELWNAQDILTPNEQLFEDSYFTKNGTELLEKVNNETNSYYNPIDVFKAAKNNFEENSLKDIFSTKSSTNDIIKEVLRRNENRANYDGVIIKNVMDYGSTTEFDDTGAAQDVYVTFNSNQFKAVDNTTPTSDPDIRYSKQSEEWDKWNNKTIAPEGTKTKLGDIKLPTKQKVSLPTKSTTEAKTSLVEPKKETTLIPMVKNNESLRVESQRIANEINKNETFKQKGWLRTATNSDVLKDSGLIKDLDPSQLNYVVQSNKKSLDKANNFLKVKGYEKSLEHVKDLLNNEGLPKASDVALMQRMIQEASKRGDVETVQNLIMDTAILGTDLGQATQALSMIKKLTPEGQLTMYTKLVERAKARGEKSFQNVEITPEMVQNILEAYDKNGNYDQDDLNARVEQFKQDLANQMKSTVGDKIDAWRYLSMLGNPKTHIRNMVSNIAMTGTIKVKNAMARTLESILPVQNRTKTWKKASQDVKDFSRETAINMKDIITGENKYNEKSAIESKKQIFKNKVLEKLSDFNGNALEGEDWFFSKRAFQSTLQEYLTANGINTYEDIQNNPEIVEKAKNYAKDQAEIATFRQYSKLASMISQVERKSKFGKFIGQSVLPFKKTPINVAKAGVSYSPLGLIKSMSYDLYQLKQGNIEASQFIDNLSQGLTGTSLTLLGYALAKAGILTGSGGDDKDDKYDKQLGNTGYSLNIGGNSYSISWLSPVAMPLLVGSNAYEQLEEQKEWDANVVSDTLAKTLDPLNEMSFMQGLTNAISSYDSGMGKIAGIGESNIQNYVGQFFPTIFSQLASTLDDKKRSTKASNDSKYKFGEQTVRSIMYKIPGLRQKLEAATDIWGNEKEQSDNIIERAFESFIAPYSKTKHIETDLDKEIKRVYNETGETGVIPGIPNSYLKYKNETYRMSANEYTDYKKTYGQNANKYLNNLIDSNSYKTASDKVKAKMINNVYDYAKAEANEQYFKKNNVDYTSDELKELEALREEGITGKQLANYVADKTQISSIKSDNDLNTKEKKNKILNIFENSELNNDQLSYLYSGYYSTEEKVRAINNVNIPIKEFIKYDLQDFESDYNAKNGKAVSNSKKIKTINYINNNLKLSAAQKALLIKLEYNTFKGYDNQIVNYIKSSNAPYLDKAYLLKRAGFNNFDREIINYVQSHIKTAKDKEEILKNMGFTVRNGRVYK